VAWLSGDRAQLLWIGHDGKPPGTAGERGNYGQIALSPDANEWWPRLPTPPADTTCGASMSPATSQTEFTSVRMSVWFGCVRLTQPITEVGGTQRGTGSRAGCSPRSCAEFRMR
jgi:hypothetical protein